MATRVLSVANSKGGVGKSTVTILLASALAKQLQKKVLILDTDSQASVWNWLESEKRIFETTPLVKVEKIMPAHVRMFLDKFGEDYDIVFIDVPRMTHGLNESATLQMLYYCDSVLIPVVGARMDVASTAEFYNLVEDAKIEKEKMDFSYTVYGFLNRESNRKDHQEAKTMLTSHLTMEMLDTSLRDLKLFTTPSLFESILDSKEGRTRFESFFKEVVQKLKLK